MTQLTENVFAVEVPEMADTPEISIQDDGFPCLTYWYKENIDPTVIDLPPGSWQLLCTTKETTWLQAAGMVEHYRGGFVNYESNSMPKVAAYSTPFLSLNSLLASKGLDPNNNYALLKKG